MTRRFVSTNAFSAVAAGSQATLDLPVGPVTYHGLQLTYTTGTAGGANQANMETEITECRVKVNGKEQRRFSARELFDILAFYGIGFQTGILYIPFSEPWRRSVTGEDSLAWGTHDIDTLQVEVDIAGSATNPTLSARALVERVARPMGPIVKWRRFNVPVSATGIRTLTTLPRTDAYYAIHCDSTNISDVEVKVDQAEVFKATKAQADALYQSAAPRTLTPQSDWFHIVFDPTHRVSDALAMAQEDDSGAVRAVQELRVDFNMAAASSFNVLTLTLGPRD